MEFSLKENHLRHGWRVPGQDKNRGNSRIEELKQVPECAARPLAGSTGFSDFLGYNFGWHEPLWTES